MTGADGFVQGREQVLGELRRPVQAEARNLVLDGRVVEPMDEGCFVVRKINARHGRQQRGHFIVHAASDKEAEGGVGHDGGDCLEPGQKAEIGHREVAAVQQAQLHGLIRRDIRDKLRPGQLPRRPAI